MIFENGRDESVYFCEKNCVCGAHIHKSVEIIYVEKGEKTICISGKDYTLQTGDFAVSYPYETHQYNGDGQLQLCVTLPVQYSEKFYILTEKKYPADNIFRKSAFTHDIFNHLKLIKNCSNEILLCGITNYVLGKIIENTILLDKNKTHTNMVNDILMYIDKHYNEDIDLEKISKAFNYSKYYFSTIFNNFFNTNLSTYINNVRVYKSLPLLIQGENLSVIYNKVGFKNPQQYFLYFKKLLGVTPHKYISTHKTKKEINK